jgi:hypothetical protein
MSVTNYGMIAAAGDVATEERRPRESAHSGSKSVQQRPASQSQVPVPQQLAASHQPRAARGWRTVYVPSVHTPSQGPHHQRNGARYANVIK